MCVPLHSAFSFSGQREEQIGDTSLPMGVYSSAEMGSPPWSITSMKMKGRVSSGNQVVFRFSSRFSMSSLKKKWPGHSSNVAPSE